MVTRLVWRAELDWTATAPMACGPEMMMRFMRAYRTFNAAARPFQEASEAHE